MRQRSPLVQHVNRRLRLSRFLRYVEPVDSSTFLAAFQAVCTQTAATRST